MARDEEGFWVEDDEFQTLGDVLREEARDGNLRAFLSEEEENRARNRKHDGTGSCECLDCLREAAYEAMAEAQWHID